MDVGISIVVTIVLVLVNGYFSMSEAAFVHARRAALQKEAEEGDRQAKRANDLAGDPERLLATTQIFVTLIGFFASVVAVLNLSAPFAGWLAGFGIDWLGFIAPVLSPVLITLVVSYVILVLGRLVPQRIALANAEKVSKKVSGLFMVLQKLATPLVYITTAPANGIARLFRIKSPDERQGVSEEEIKDLVTDNPELLDDEKRMIHEIIDLGDTAVREIMQPRVDMIMVEDTETVKQAIDRMRGTGYTRLPVFQEDADCIVGIVHFKDLVAPLVDGKEGDDVGKYAFDAYFVPETKEIYPLLSEMQTNRQQMAIVVDEYGGTDGLITVEDIVEEIVGDIVDETDLEDKFITALSKDEWLVDGRFGVEDAEELSWPVEVSEDYETIAGWLMGIIDFVPQVGEEFVVEGFSFKIQAMRRRRISTIRVKRLAADDSLAHGANKTTGSKEVAVEE